MNGNLADYQVPLDEAPLNGDVLKVDSEDKLPSWAEIHQQWDTLIGDKKPELLKVLILRGIPEGLRGEVWLRLTDCYTDATTIDDYRVLVTKECSCETIIFQDVHRTLPDLVKDDGQRKALANVCRAYTVNDEEMGYCQGLSYICKYLLFHMPEEKAFCVLKKIMYDYGLRELHKDGFKMLHLSLYQLDRLIQEYLPELWNHLRECGIETDMFASDWFLNVFTAKLPPCLVFHILDVFLFQGMDTIFQVALGLLTTAEKDLRALSFEGMLKYFRIQLPKRYQNEVTARQLMELSTSSFAELNKLESYKKDWLAIKGQAGAREDPLVRLERANTVLYDKIYRLERECDGMALQLISTGIDLNAGLDAVDQTMESRSRKRHHTKIEKVEQEGKPKILASDGGGTLIAGLNAVDRTTQSQSLKRPHTEIEKDKTEIMEEATSKPKMSAGDGDDVPIVTCTGFPQAATEDQLKMVNISKVKCKYFTGMVFVTFFTKEEATSFLGLPSVKFHKIPIKRKISMKSTKKEEQQEVSFSVLKLFFQVSHEMNSDKLEYALSEFEDKIIYTEVNLEEAFICFNDQSANVICDRYKGVLSVQGDGFNFSAVIYPADESESDKLLSKAVEETSKKVNGGQDGATPEKKPRTDGNKKFTDERRFRALAAEAAKIWKGFKDKK